MKILRMALFGTLLSHSTHGITTDAGILHLLVFNSDLSSCSGFTTEHPKDKRLLFITAAHCVRRDEAFSVLFGKTTFSAGAKGGVGKISNDNLIAYYPPSEGDVAVFDASKIEISSRNNDFISALEFHSRPLEVDSKLSNFAAPGLFSDFFVRACRFKKIEKTYKSGIELGRMECDIPAAMKNGQGTSGSPIVIKETQNLVGLVRGGFGQSQTSVGFSVFNLSKLLDQQADLKNEELKNRVLSKAKLEVQLSQPF